MPPAPLRRVAHARQTRRSPSSHSHGSAWSINAGQPPLLDELFELGIGRFREHHLQGDVLVAPPPSGRNTPFPFRRNTRPVLVHFGTVIVTAPDGVGTATLPPSTASFSEIGSST